MNNIKLKDQLNSLKHHKFIMVQPGGNWGDYLIYFGMDCLAAQCGLEFEHLTKNEFLSRKPEEGVVVYIDGGGVFTEWCSDSAFVCLKHALSNYSGPVISGPCSSTSNSAFLEEKFSQCLSDFTAESLTIYARESTTLGIFNSLACFNCDRVSIENDCDTALHLTKDAVLQRVGEERFKYDLYAFREDNEVGNTRHEKNYHDVILDPAYFAVSFEHWLRLHVFARSIVTNRTHSSVIGAVLGKPTTLFAGRYHKNRGIWEQDLRSMGVEWAGDDVMNRVSEGVWDKLLPSFIKSSWKVRSTYLALSGVPLK